MWNVGIIQTNSKSKSSRIDKAETKSFPVTYSGCHINTTYVCKTTMKDGNWMGSVPDKNIYMQVYNWAKGGVETSLTEAQCLQRYF